MDGRQQLLPQFRRGRLGPLEAGLEGERRATTARPKAPASNNSKSSFEPPLALPSHPLLSVQARDVVLGALQRQIAVSRTMSSSQCLRRLAATTRQTYPIRCAPNTSTTLLRAPAGVRTLATTYASLPRSTPSSKQRYTTWEWSSSNQTSDSSAGYHPT